MKQNYLSWTIDDSEIKPTSSPVEILQHLARYALLSPSGHNTQPWKFTISEKRQTLQIEINPAKKLHFSGKLAAEPYVSVGACLATLELAAKGFGYQLEVKKVLEKNVIYRIKVTGTSRPIPELTEAIKSRVSNRNLYTSQPIELAVLNQIVKIPYNKIAVKVINNKSDIAYLAEATNIATKKIMSEKGFRAELSTWVRNNMTRQFDGMPGKVQGMNLPKSVLAKHVVRRIDISTAQAKLDSGRLLHSPAVLLLTVSDTSTEAYLELGAAYATICVYAQMNGLATSGVGAAVIDPETRASVKEHFRVIGEPSALIRIGYCKQSAPRTPRHYFEQVVTISD